MTPESKHPDWHVTDAFGNDHFVPDSVWLLRDNIVVFYMDYDFEAEIACFTDPAAVVMCNHAEPEAPTAPVIGKH